MDRLVIGKYRAGLLAQTNSLVEQSFKNAFSNGYAAACASLRRSTYDGSAQHIEDALELLKDQTAARATWDGLGITTPLI